MYLWWTCGNLALPKTKSYQWGAFFRKSQYWYPNCRHKMRNASRNKWGSSSESSSFHCHCTRIAKVPNFVITWNNWVTSEQMFHHTYLHTWKSIHALAVHALHYACAYPAATQKGVADFWITMHKQMHVHTGIKIFSLRSYIAIYVTT